MAESTIRESPHLCRLPQKTSAQSNQRLGPPHPFLPLYPIAECLSLPCVQRGRPWALWHSSCIIGPELEHGPTQAVCSRYRRSISAPAHTAPPRPVSIAPPGPGAPQAANCRRCRRGWAVPTPAAPCSTRSPPPPPAPAPARALAPAPPGLVARSARPQPSGCAARDPSPRTSRAALRSLGPE